MRPPSGPAATRAVHLYDGAPRGDRFHVRARWWSAPFPAIEQRIPRTGRVLEVGCGHGLLCFYLALSSPARSVVGVDIDAHKIELARDAADHLVAGEASVTFAVVAPGDLPEGEFEAVLIADVLYLMPEDMRRAVLAACVQRLAPGGVLVVKEVDVTPRWKHRIAHLQEVLATRVFRFTEGEALEIAPMADFASQLRDAGLDVEIVRVDRGYVHPHAMVIGHRPPPA